MGIYSRRARKTDYVEKRSRRQFSMKDKGSDKAVPEQTTIVDQLLTIDADSDRFRNMTISQLISEKGIDAGVALDKEEDDEITSILADKDPQKYVLGNILAKGGMGVILNAKDINCRRSVAMKKMHDGERIKKEKIVRFINEAQITAQLEHPSIVPVYELSVDARGDVFYTMKKVDGLTLVQIINRIRAEDEEVIAKYSLMRLLNIFLKVCEAVAYAHSKHVVHRDLKPENIMIGGYGEVLLMDWGLAKVIDAGVRADSSDPDEDKEYLTELQTIDTIVSDKDMIDKLKTVKGQVLGTPGFMPPEQALGKVQDINTRSDVYALGGILYNILTLEPPVTGLYLRQVLRDIVSGNIEPPVSHNAKNSFPHCPYHRIPQALSAVAMKALETTPNHRYQSVEELQDDVEKYLGGFATSVEDAGIFKLLMLLVKRNLKEVIITGSVLLIIFFVVTGSMIKIVEAKNLAEENLNKFLYEQNARQEISRTLLKTALKDLAEKNPGLNMLTHRYSLTENVFALNLANDNALVNITPLSDLPLTHLNLDNTGINDLKPIKNMPLRRLSVAGTNISSIPVLKSEQLSFLDISDTRIKDLLPIAGTKLKHLNISGSRVDDLSVIRDLPLESFVVDGDQIKNLDSLMELSLVHLGLRNAKDGDLRILQQMRLKSLDLHGRFISSLHYLQGAQLAHLSIQYTKMKDFSILKDLPLESLKFSNSLITDISVVKELELKELRLEKCYFLSDLKPIAECKTLEKLLIPPHVTDIEYLKDLPNLKVLSSNVKDYESNQSVAEFWDKYQSQTGANPGSSEP
jgi:serine/threonine protein kinase